MIKLVLLATADRALSAQLVDIMNTDSVLAQALGGLQPCTTDEFIQSNTAWSVRCSAEIFAIVLDERAVGMMSLSHQNVAERTARIGYFLGSSYWGNGYTGEAFRQMLEYAREKGFLSVSASIKPDNAASLRIWEKHGARMQAEETRVRVRISFAGPPGEEITDNEE